MSEEIFFHVPSYSHRQASRLIYSRSLHIVFSFIFVQLSEIVR